MSDIVLRNIMIQSYPDLVNTAHTLSSALGSEYVKDALSIEDSSVILADLPPREALEANVRWAFSTGTDRDAILSLLKDSLTRRIYNGARHTITGTVESIPGARFARYTRPGSKCDFCRMLATRGAVYGSAKSAGGEGADFHDGCHCVVVAVPRKSDYVMSQHIQEWKDQKIWVKKDVVVQEATN